MKAAGILVGSLAWAAITRAELRTEYFDVEPPGWEGVNNSNAFFEAKAVEQNFGFSAETNHAGGQRGEVGGRINPAGEPAYYGFRLPRRLNLDSPLSAEGRLFAAKGSSHCLMGFFNVDTLNGWRTPNTLVARLNGRGESFHCHIEYATGLWRAGAGVIGEIVPGSRISPLEIPAGSPLTWKMEYTPANDGSGTFTFTMSGHTATCTIEPAHRRDGMTFTHFGLLPVMKTWDGAGDVWIDDVKINGASFDFAADPKWDESGNRRKYTTSDTRPKFDFGWSATSHAGGAKPGELGGLVFRGDCREPARMACYGDRLEPLSLKSKLVARGKIAVLRAISDSTASIGFYHSKHSMEKNPSQKNATPADYLGINIEGPSSEGFFFYPVCRTHGDESAVAGYDGGKAPRIYPDGKSHDWFLTYDPAGDGVITVGLDEQRCTLKLPPVFKSAGANFDRFGICTPWIDGNSVIVYFDDLTYTCGEKFGLPFDPPAKYEGKSGAFRSPLLFDDGSRITNAADWPRRRAEISKYWHETMGQWPPLLEKPKTAVLRQEKRENFSQRRLLLEVAPEQMQEGWLLVPEGPGPFPAVLVVYYEPETSAGLTPGEKGAFRDYGLQLARRGFVTLSIGSPGGNAWKPELGKAVCQPLSFHAYVAANAWTALAALPQVDPKRIGIVGHSYGGKWALFAAALWDKFAAVAISDPGIVWDETRANVNYWEPWYLGHDAALKEQRKPGIPSDKNPRTGPYAKLVADGRDLTDLHALICPRPFLVSGGAEDQPERWIALNHARAVNDLLGVKNRVAMTNRPNHTPDEDANAAVWAFFEQFMK